MTLKTFWSVLIKLIGLYLIWQLLILLPSIISIFCSRQDLWGRFIYYPGYNP